MVFPMQTMQSVARLAVSEPPLFNKGERSRQFSFHLAPSGMVHLPWFWVSLADFGWVLTLDRKYLKVLKGRDDTVPECWMHYPNC